MRAATENVTIRLTRGDIAQLAFVIRFLREQWAPKSLRGLIRIYTKLTAAYGLTRTDALALTERD